MQTASFLITGIPASGKSTVAQALAQQLPRSVHLRGDIFRRMIINSRAEMAPGDDQAAFDQLRLRYRLLSQSLDTYAAEGFTVVAQDVILGPLLAEVVGTITSRPLAVIVLAPSAAAVTARESDRDKTGYGPWSVEALDRVLREQTPRIGLWLDTSEQTVAETVAEISGRLREGFVS